ncbi:hypothetical protein C2E20_9143 [Micractinium conductrix]|uniref:Chromo domain-containing protein n=1 Tax=Micractinium conductrix TaxID=554055 RepID=A0A2P6UZC5_9CHLO|nr:hypothetical protein C2E20_9143 [Micractinium conductrix]|eukprot:PSC67164.1 hypothetical protein C2E20_9143 [Micractinium conductrix]
MNTAFVHLVRLMERKPADMPIHVYYQCIAPILEAHHRCGIDPHWLRSTWEATLVAAPTAAAPEAALAASRDAAGISLCAAPCVTRCLVCSTPLQEHVAGHKPYFYQDLQAGVQATAIFKTCPICRSHYDINDWANGTALRLQREEFFIKWHKYRMSASTWEPREIVLGEELPWKQTTPRAAAAGAAGETQSEAGQEQVEGGGDGSGGDAPRRRRFKTCSARKPDKRNPHTSGALFAFTACGAMFPAIEAVGCKTTALVLYYLLLLYALHPFPLIISFDDMCHLARYAMNPTRMEASPKVAQFVDTVIKVVDFFHFNKNHTGKWCHKHVNPHKCELLKGHRHNLSICEQRFKWVSQFKTSLSSHVPV